MDNPAAPIPSISPQPAAEPEASTPSESSNRHWLLWLAGGLFMLIIGIAIGVFSAKLLNQSQGQTQLTPTNSPELPPQSLTPTLISDPTANWKTYISQSGYSLKYPPEWKIKTGDWTESGDHYGVQPDDEAVIRYRNPNQEIRGGPPDAVSISLKHPLDNRLLINKTDFAKQYLSSSYDYKGPINMEVVTIGETSATKASRSDFPSISNFFIPQGDKMFLIVFNPTGDSTAIGTYQQAFNQILSTFHFLK